MSNETIMKRSNDNTFFLLIAESEINPKIGESIIRSNNREVFCDKPKYWGRAVKVLRVAAMDKYVVVELEYIDKSISDLVVENNVKQPEITKTEDYAKIMNVGDSIYFPSEMNADNQYQAKRLCVHINKNIGRATVKKDDNCGFRVWRIK